MIKCYSELKKLKTFDERFDYLKLKGIVGESTFGYDRYLNQALYHSQDWASVRDKVIIRDGGCDLGISGYEIYDRIIIHHMIPITEKDIIRHSDWIYDPEYLICTSIDTHNAIHYGTDNGLRSLPKERSANDTCPWL